MKSDAASDEPWFNFGHAVGTDLRCGGQDAGTAPTGCGPVPSLCADCQQAILSPTAKQRDAYGRFMHALSVASLVGAATAWSTSSVLLFWDIARLLTLVVLAAVLFFQWSSGEQRRRLMDVIFILVVGFGLAIGFGIIAVRAEEEKDRRRQAASAAASGGKPDEAASSA
ncbi:hypothetical protein [Roseateles aquatilis]|nr:hypothetical protein [Roseateles aquatilis]